LVVGRVNVNVSYHRGHPSTALRAGSGHRVDTGEEVAGGEEGFAEVAGDDFFRIADGGEVDAGVPTEEYIDVRRYMLELFGGEDSRHSRFLTGLWPCSE
jgi:hypothetical protein